MMRVCSMRSCSSRVLALRRWSTSRSFRAGAIWPLVAALFAVAPDIGVFLLLRWRPCGVSGSLCRPAGEYGHKDHVTGGVDVRVLVMCTVQVGV